ncbi:hypothetical protein HDU93_007245 [Gonapodya sp. JEL0774]|nr:hypothetical protein HDU93_007245 [Gonapodya sp. JEL0774]
MFTSGVLYIGNSASGVPPKWAAAADLDAVQLANGLVALSFGGFSWIIFIGSLAAAALGRRPSKNPDGGDEDGDGAHILHEDHGFDQDEGGEAGVVNAQRSGGSGLRAADKGDVEGVGDVEMEAFLEHDE